MLSHHLIWHGRRCCHAQKPACGACPVARWCPSYGAGPDRPRGRRQAAPHRGPSVRPRLGASALAAAVLAALAGCDDETPRARPRTVAGRRRHPGAPRAQGRDRHGRLRARDPAAAGCPRSRCRAWAAAPASTCRPRGPLVLNLWAPGAALPQGDAGARRSSTTTYGDAGAGASGSTSATRTPAARCRRSRRRGVTYPLARRPGRRPPAFDEFAEDPGHADHVLRRRERRGRLPAVRRRRLGRRGRRPGPRAPRGQPVTDRDAPRLAATGRGGAALDHRRTT